MGEGKDISDVKIYTDGFSSNWLIIRAFFGSGSRYHCLMEEMGDVVT